MIVRAIVVAIVMLAEPLLLAQSRGEPRRVGLDEQAALTRIVEDVATGKLASGHAWLTCLPHFLRGSDGKTYVPFTLTIEEAPAAFRSAAVYIRVAPRGDEGRSNKAEGVQNLIGVPAGELPVSTPDRRIYGRGATTPAEASMALRSLTGKPSSMPYPYEAAYGIESVPAARGAAAHVRRALAVAPGEYDLYVAVLEREGKGEKKWAVLKQPLTVPDMTGGGLRLSSAVLADRVELLNGPLSAAEQTLRPYALGSAELVPALDATLRQDETLHVAFLIYNASADGRGKPDVRIEYRLFLQQVASERLLAATAPQTLDASTLPPLFDLRKGEQLAAMQSMPLSSYKPGSYRIAIRVTDNRSGATAEENLRFVLVAN